MSQAPESASFRSVDAAQRIWQVACTVGAVHPESPAEITTRLDLASQLYSSFQSGGRLQDLHDAVHHIETITRRLPTRSPIIPGLQVVLSDMKLSEYLICRSTWKLEDAIDLAFKARAEATRQDVLDAIPNTYFESLVALGTAQAHRYNNSYQLQDLDDAISSGKEMECRFRKSDEHCSVNLTTRLLERWRRHCNDSSTERNTKDEYREIMLRIEKQLKSFAPGSGVLRAVTLRQLADTLYENFTITRCIDDLEEAIRHGRASLDEMPEMGDNRAFVLTRLSRMHGERYQITKDAADWMSAVMYSKMCFRCSPLSHAVSGKRLQDHLWFVRKFANATVDLPVVAKLAENSAQLMQEMAVDYPERELCQWIYGDVLSRRYTLSEDLEDLIAIVNHTQDIRLKYNVQAVKEGKAESTTDKLRYLLRNLSTIAKALPGKRAKLMASKKLHEYFQSTREANAFPNIAIQMYIKYGVTITAYAKACEIDSDDTEEGIKRLVTMTELDIYSSIGHTHEGPAKPRWRPKEYHTALGLRTLATNAGSKVEFFDIRGKACELYGYEDDQPLQIEQFVQREIRLERESWERDRKEGRRPDAPLCRICRKIEVLMSSAHGCNWNPKVWWVPFGNFWQLYCRRFCAICGLILTLISENENPMPHPRLMNLDIEVQGTHIDSRQLCSENKILQVRYGSKAVGALSIISLGNFQTTLRQGFEIRDSLAPEAFLGNLYDTLVDGTQRIRPFQLRKWLNDCDHNHGWRCNSVPSDQNSPLSGPRYLLDVVNECLVRVTSRLRYFALSYVWGTIDMSSTVLANHSARQKMGGLRQDSLKGLPKTVRDAMLLVKSLNERYLWVDALCIVQDDEENKQQDIETMDIVYQQAFATIVALHGSDADAGLPGIQPHSRVPQAYRFISTPAIPLILEEGSTSMVPGPALIAATPMSLKLALDVSIWNSRAWTFQERLLSRRCLYFTENCVYFQCNSQTLSEIFINDLSQEGTDDNLDKSLLGLRNADKVQNPYSIQCSFSAYRELIQSYTPLHLSFPSDILNASAGLFNVFSRHFPGTILFGLPVAFLDLALLWTPAEQLERRQCLVRGIRQWSQYPPNEESLCPTWSWCGYSGPVNYQLFPHDATGALPVALVDTFALCVQGSVYYSRNGDLLPIYAHPIEETSVPMVGNMADTRTEYSDLQELHKKIETNHGANVLQFQAYTLPARSFWYGRNEEYLSRQENVHEKTSQSIRRLYDEAGNHCGLYFNGATTCPSDGQSHLVKFIAISRYEERDQPCRGPSRVEGVIPLFDSEVYPPIGPGSGLVNVLVVLLGESGIAERINVATIHAAAWEAAEPVKELVRLG